MKTIHTQIQPIGSFFQNDSKGFVINPAYMDKIPSHWIPVVEQVKKAYLDHLKDNLHSIYLRGSLVRGITVDGISDLDSFAIVKKQGIRWEKTSWLDQKNNILTEQFPFVKEVEFMLSSVDQDLSLEHPKVAMLLKTQSLCIHGTDLSSTIPKFRPDRSMMLHYRWIETDTQEFIANNDRSNTSLKDFLKGIIRTGYELIMEKEGQFTPDLFLCYDRFTNHFPKKGPIMKEALYCYLNPFKWDEEKEKELLDLSKWLIEKVKIELF